MLSASWTGAVDGNRSQTREARSPQAALTSVQSNQSSANWAGGCLLHYLSVPLTASPSVCSSLLNASVIRAQSHTLRIVVFADRKDPFTVETGKEPFPLQSINQQIHKPTQQNVRCQASSDQAYRGATTPSFASSYTQLFGAD